MVKYYRSYKVFLSGTFMKLVMYLIYPVVAVLWCGLMIFATGSSTGEATYGLLMTTGMVISAELLLDNFIYGSILAKDTNKLEYLKTSHRGMSVLKKSLCVDKLRRLMTSVLIFVIVYNVCNEQVSVGQLISLILVTVSVAELGLLAIRHFSSFNWTIILIMVANALGALVGFLAVKLAPIFAVLFLLLAVVVAMKSNKITIKKAERGFYDAGVEKVL